MIFYGFFSCKNTVNRKNYIKMCVINFTGFPYKKKKKKPLQFFTVYTQSLELISFITSGCALASLGPPLAEYF